MDLDQGPQIHQQNLGGRLRQTDMYAVVNAIFYPLRTGSSGGDFSLWERSGGTIVCWYHEGVLVKLHWALYPLVRIKAGRRQKPSIVITDSQSVKTTKMEGISNNRPYVFWELRDHAGLTYNLPGVSKAARLGGLSVVYLT